MQSCFLSIAFDSGRVWYSHTHNLAFFPDRTFYMRHLVSAGGGSTGQRRRHGGCAAGSACVVGADTGR